MTESYPKFLKIISKPSRRLDYARLNFTSSTPSLDNAIIKLWGAHTRQWTIACAFSPSKRWCFTCDAATINGRVMIFEDFSFSILRNFDKLNINYNVILSKI